MVFVISGSSHRAGLARLRTRRLAGRPLRPLVLETTSHGDALSHGGPTGDGGCVAGAKLPSDVDAGLELGGGIFF